MQKNRKQLHLFLPDALDATLRLKLVKQLLKLSVKKPTKRAILQINFDQRLENDFNILSAIKALANAHK